MAEWHVGQRVIYISDYPYEGRTLRGLTGTIVGIMPSPDNRLQVDWNELITGHNCRGKARPGHGWNVPGDLVRLEEAEEVPSINFSFDEFVRGGIHEG